MYSLRECCNKPINGKERQDIMHRPSDYFIVSRKSVKADGEKGVAVMRGVQGRHLPGTQNWRRGGNET